MSDENLGIKGILIAQLQQKYDSDIVEKIMKVYELTADKSWELDETKEALEAAEKYVKVRNSAGAYGKAKRYQPMKDKVTKAYNKLKSENLGKNPTFKVLNRELESLYPAEDWNEDTLADWHKKLNKGYEL